MLAVTIVAASSLPATAQAQETTVLRGSPSRPYPSVDCSNPYYSRYCQDNQSSGDSPEGYASDYPYYGDSFPVVVGVRRRFFHHHGGGFHSNVHRGGFRSGVFHGGGSHGGCGHS